MSVAIEWQNLSANERKAVELVATGKSLRAAAAEMRVSHTTVQNYLKKPGALAYLAYLGRQAKGRIYARSGALLEERLDWGGLPLRDLIAIWDKAMPDDPREVVVRIQRQAVEFLGEYEQIVCVMEESLCDECRAVLAERLTALRNRAAAARAEVAN